MTIGTDLVDIVRFFSVPILVVEKQDLRADRVCDKDLDSSGTHN